MLQKKIPKNATKMAQKYQKMAENNDDFFMYQPNFYKKKGKNFTKKDKKTSPFQKLSEIRFR